MERFDFGGEIVWRPTPELIAQSNLKRFMERHGFASLEELQTRSTTDIAWFWDAVLKELDVRFAKAYSRVVDLARGIAWPQWCVGGQMNIVHNCLDKYAGTPTDQKLALRAESENGDARTLTYAELRREVN
jgi:acetyl-CoA synthetase